MPSVPRGEGREKEVEGVRGRCWEGVKGRSWEGVKGRCWEGVNGRCWEVEMMIIKADGREGGREGGSCWEGED